MTAQTGTAQTGTAQAGTVGTQAQVGTVTGTLSGTATGATATPTSSAVAQAAQGQGPLSRRGGQRHGHPQVLAHGRHHRAHPQAAVVGRLLGHGQARDGRRAPRRAEHHAQGQGEDVVPLAGQHRAVVRLAPALVGPPHPGLLCHGPGREEGGGHRRADAGAGAAAGVRKVRVHRGRAHAGAGRGCARHVVLVGPVAVRHRRLAAERGRGGLRL